MSFSTFILLSCMAYLQFMTRAYPPSPSFVTMIFIFVHWTKSKLGFYVLFNSQDHIGQVLNIVICGNQTQR